MKNFKDKKIVITGGGSGMGRHLAYQLADLGAEIFITDINEETVNETAKDIIAKGGKCKPYVVDSGSEKDIYAFAGKILLEEKWIDVLFNNAGMALGEITLVEVKEEHLKKIMDVNLWGVIHFTRAFLPTMLTRPEAHLVNTISVFGIIGVKTQVPYCTTKFAVRGFTEALRMELVGTNVTVSCVHPGGIKTNIARNGIHYKNSQKSIDKLDKVAITSAEDAATIIINGMKKNKQKILIGRDAWLVDRLARRFPVAYTSIFLWIEKKFMKE
ncbi:MAG: 3-oxoacyl-(acyl-carrier-protein) reductase [Bacteroidota bacterium]|nr:3-oxoacyl-(acyl-carrier-protein) reductase [Bacteroidota bacterium]